MSDLSKLKAVSDLLQTIEYLEQSKSILLSGPKTRERSLVITKLDEAIMWAKEAYELENPGS